VNIQTFLPIARANAVRAAHGDPELFQDAVQDGLLEASRALQAANPVLGDVAQYVCLRMTAARGQARSLVTEPVDSFSDLQPLESDEEVEFPDETPEFVGEPMGLGPDDVESTGWVYTGPFTRDLVENLVAWTLEMLQAIAWDSANPTIVDLSHGRRRTSDLQALETYWRFRANTQMLADEPVLFPLPVPAMEQLGEPFSQFEDEIDSLSDSRPDRRLGWMDKNGDGPDNSLEIELPEDDDSIWLPEAPEPVSLPGDSLWGPRTLNMSLPTQWELELELNSFFFQLPKPSKYSRASREAFIRAMLAGNSMKEANKAAWAVNKRTLVAATPKGLKTGAGVIIPFARAASELNKWQLDMPAEYICAKLAHLVAAKAYVQALEAAT